MSLYNNVAESLSSNGLMGSISSGISSSVGGAARDDLAIGARVFHSKFGMGTVKGQDGNKLEIEFDSAGTKMVLDSFVSPA